MIPIELRKKGCVDFDVVFRPANGETTCGDDFLVKPFDKNVLLAVIDGAGHGKQAADTAASAVAFLERHTHKPLVPLMAQCHEHLSKSRGVAMTMISIHPDENVLNWLAVGNVSACVVRADCKAKPRYEHVLLRGGIVGYQLPLLHAGTLPINCGDWVIMVSDGIRADFCVGLEPALAPEMVATQILSRHFKGNDDALVLVARYTGNAHE